MSATGHRLPDVLVILADDLSGAADCGIVCSQAGLRTLVILGDRDATPGTEVLAVDADTRGRAEADAVAETERLTQRYAGPGVRLYKKLDSTLRGHVGAELAAALRARRQHGPAFIVFAPAYPATGRTTVGGVQRLHGVPLEQTEMWRREAIPHRALPCEMLERAGLRTGLIGLDQVRRPGLEHAMAAGDRDAVVCDAETEADLQAIAAAASRLGPGVIWAGSAGLARYLPAAVGLAGPAAPVVVPPAAGPILFVVGSLSATSHTQVAALMRQPGMQLLTVPPAVLRAGRQDPRWAAQERLLDAALGTGGDVVTVLGRDPGDAPLDLAEGLRLCHALAALAAPHVSRIGALVSTGGETARAVLQAFRADGLHLAGEIEPGVPLSVAEGIHHLPVVTKAGAFGTPETFVHCRHVLRRGSIAAVPNPESSPA